MKLNHFQIFERAFKITINYRALWIFGIIIALAVGGASGGGGGGGNSGAQYSGGDMPGEFNPGSLTELLTPTQISVLIGVGIALVLFVIIYGIAITVARYVSESALIQMVYAQEETGEIYTVKQGFKLGWSRSAWRLFLIGLVIGIPFAFAFAMGIVLAMSPLLLWFTNNEVLGILGTVSAIGFFFLLVFVAIVVGTIINTLFHFFWRVCVIEKRGVFESIREGFALVKQNLKDVALMWLYMVVLQLVLGIVLVVVFLLLMVLVGVVALLPAILIWGVVSIFASGAWPWIIAGIVAVLIFVLLISIPSLFIGGLVETFKSTVWTLTYRELRIEETWVDKLEVPAS